MQRVHCGLLINLLQRSLVIPDPMGGNFNLCYLLVQRWGEVKFTTSSQCEDLILSVKGLASYGCVILEPLEESPPPLSGALVDLYRLPYYLARKHFGTRVLNSITLSISQLPVHLGPHPLEQFTQIVPLTTTSSATRFLSVCSVAQAKQRGPTALA